MYFRKKANKKIWIFFFLVQTCGAILSLVITIFNSFALSVPKGYFNEIRENFKDHPLMDISEMVSSCQKNQSQITFGKWPGTKHGCNCIGKYPVKSNCTDSLCVGKCSLDETNAGCIDVDEISSVNINIWKGKRLCSSQTKYSYEELLNMSVGEREHCPDGYKNCGKLDSVNNILCYPKNEDCPINDLVVTFWDRPPLQYKYQTIPLDNEYYLHFTNEAIDNFVVRSKIKAGDESPCIDSNEYNSLGPYYILNAGGGCTKSYKLEKYNPYYWELDTFSKYDVYQENGIIDKINSLPHYPLNMLQNYHYSIFRGGFIGFFKDCKNQYQTITEIISAIDSTFTFIKNLNISSFAFLICELIILCIFSCELFISNSFSKINYEGFIFCFFCFLVFILEIIAYSLPSSIQIPAQCSDLVSNTIMRSITAFIDTVRFRNLVVAIFSVSKIMMFFFDIPLGIIQDRCYPVKNTMNEPIIITELNSAFIKLKDK